MSLARRTNLETLDKSQFICFLIYPYLLTPHPKRHFGSKMSRWLVFHIYFLGILIGRWYRWGKCFNRHRSRPRWANTRATL